MDELLHHCIRELAFEGDLGCDVNRLQDFIIEFYAHTGAKQTVDAAYCAFVWSVVAQHPEVRVGIAPEGAPEVYIAPQNSKTASASKSKKKKGDEEEEEGSTVGKLEVIEDAAVRPLDDLKEQYNDKLRIAVDPERSLVAITGSHIRSPKLTPMVYTALQLISRGREAGLSAVDLSKKTGYDAKTCHYLIEKLVDLNLIEKRKKSGVGTNFCIHKYFFERSEVWKGVLAEEGKARLAAVKKEEKDDADLDVDDTTPVISTMGHLNFEPMDSRHLTSLAIIRDRVEKLLRSSPHNMHSAQNLLVILGFANPLKTDRRFFQTRIRELIAQGFIEKVQVPKPNGKLVPCIRLLNPDKPAQPPRAPSVIEIFDDGDSLVPLKTNLTLHRQMIDLIHQSGTDGLTLNQLSQALCAFDKRTLDHQLNRLKDTPLPGHIRDLGVTQVAETYGRERRYKYFTFENYRKVVEREKLGSPYPDGFFDAVGGYLPIEDDQLYESEAELNSYMDSYERGGKKGSKKGKDKAASKTPRGTKRKRDADDAEADNPGEGEASSSMAPPAKKKRGRPPKVRAQPPTAPVVPADDDGVPVAMQAPEGVLAIEPSSTAKKRGRPRKHPVVEIPTLPKKRGRPPKKKVDDTDVGAVEQITVPDDPFVIEAGPSTAPRERLEPVSSTLRKGSVAEVAAEAASLVPQVDIPSREGLTDTRDTSASAVALGGAEPAAEAALQTLPSSALVPSASATTSGAKGPAEPLEKNQLEASTSVDIEETDQNKRSAPGSPTPQPPAKRLKVASSLGGYRGRTNLSQSRREKEILRLITDMGGIANVSTKEFFDGHSTLLEKLSMAGEAVSDNRQGSKIDKRTMDATLKGLRDQGAIKLITTAVNNRQVRVAYLAETEQEDLNEFLAGLVNSATVSVTQTASVKTLDSPLLYGGSKLTKIAKPQNSITFIDVTPDDVHENAHDISSLHGSKLRDALLSEPQTVKQLYGYISGKIARVQELHLHVMKLFEEATNPYIVSSGQKVVHVSYFHQDLPVSLYCAIVSSPVPSRDLKQLLSTPEGRATPLRQVPVALAEAIELNKARSRSRILDALVTLQDLHVITPLVPTDSKRPWLRCSPNGDYPTAFDAIQCDGGGQAPQYWRFNTSIPIHLWAKEEVSPPFWMESVVQSCADAVAFWRQLQRASLDLRYVDQLMTEREEAGLPSATSVPANIPIRLVRLLKRATQWRPSYCFSDNQKYVLKRYTDFQTGGTPLQDADGGNARILEISDLISAPQEEVVQFYTSERQRMLHNIEKMRRKGEAREKRESSKRRTDADERANLAQKAAEARAQRERDWEEMLVRVHPEPLAGTAAARVTNVRKRFLQGAGTDHQKWEAEISAAIEQSKIPAKRATANRVPLLAYNPVHSAPVPVRVHSNEKSVEELVALQGPALAKQEALTKSKKGKEKEKQKEKDKEKEDADQKVTRRRHRFAWTKDYEELARDASAVIRARARDGKRLDWGALEQVFRAIPRNTVRQRIAQLRDYPGAEAYFKRLEDKWYELWVKHRGTPELPDDDPTSMWNFDLVAHITFLRGHVDKNALRVGFLESEEEQHSIALPASVSDLMAQFNVIEKAVLAPTYDFMWNNAAEEGREKLLMHQPFVVSASSELRSSQTLEMHAYPYERAYVGDAALKMTLATPNETYDAEQAADLLKSVGQEAVDIAVKGMLERGVISKLVRDPKKNKPGRLLKIADQNQNALGGPVASDLFQDALALEDALESSHLDGPLAWREWPLTASDGDAAALIELVSEGKIEFKIDTHRPQAARVKIDWNSKKADDDDIETAIHLRCCKDLVDTRTATALPCAEIPANSLISDVLQISQSSSPGRADVHQPSPVIAGLDLTDQGTQPVVRSSGHGKTLGGERASCWRETDPSGPSDGVGAQRSGIADCVACLDMELAKCTKDDELLLGMWTALVDAGAAGLTKQNLKASFDSVDQAKLANVVSRLVAHGLGFWAGYKDVVFVSAHFLSWWTVIIPMEATPAGQSTSQEADTVSMKPLTRVFPCRWLDVTGRKMADIWEAACRAIIGTVVIRPGISQTELRWRLRNVYDRREMHDLLMHLLEGKHLSVRRSSDIFVANSFADDAEEKVTFWFVGEKRWFGL